MHQFLTFGLVLLALVGYSQQKILLHKVVVKSSYISIRGTTNLNTFTCSLEQPYTSTAIPVKSTNGDYEISFDGLELVYLVANFNCELKAMNQDLQTTLKADIYPKLTLNINDIFIKKQPQEIEYLDVRAGVTITLAGISQDFMIQNGQVINRSEASLTLKGNQKISMEAFDLIPPTKFFGMVKVNTEMQVSFEINLEINTED